MTPPPALPVDPRLRERFRAAAAQISWIDESPRKPPKPSAPAKGARKGKARAPAPVRTNGRRIAHLNDEEAHVETHAEPEAVSVQVDSGPLGALVLLIEMERLGPPSLLTTHDGGKDGRFPEGSIEALWSAGPVPNDDPLPLDDLIRLARYALA